MKKEKLTYSILTGSEILMNYVLYTKHSLPNLMLGLSTFVFMLIMDYYIFFMEKD